MSLFSRYIDKIHYKRNDITSFEESPFYKLKTVKFISFRMCIVFLIEFDIKHIEKQNDHFLLTHVIHNLDKTAVHENYMSQTFHHSKIPTEKAMFFNFYFLGGYCAH